MMENSLTRVRWLAFVAVCFALGTNPVHAASLGNIDVKSKLYEPFHARIALRGASEGEMEGLKVKLAEDAVFERAALARPYALSKFKFEVVTTGARRGYVKITSHDRVREPSLSFIVEAQFPAGTLQRRYDVVLDLN